MKKIFLLLYVGLIFNTVIEAQNCQRYIGGDSTKTTAPYSIYREFFKKNLFAEAFPQWRNVYNNAPGFRKQTHLDGAVLYTNLIQNTKDEVLKQKYIDTLFLIYNKQIACYGEDEYVLGKKGIDLLKYGKNSDIPEARKCLEKNINLTGDNAFPYYIQTYFKLLANQNGRDNITTDFIKTEYTRLSTILDKNISNPNNKQLQSYKEVKSVIDELYTQSFVDKNDPTDCAKLLEIYKKKYTEKPNDLETIKLVDTKTKTCGDSALNLELLKKLNAMDPNYRNAIRLGNIYMKNKQFDDAYILYQNGAAKEVDSIKKSDLYYIMASLKADKNDFPTARTMAQQALVYNPNLGKANLLIGTLYAASGKLCGPGTGFQSQIVLWPAFDYFNKAKQDPSTAEEAQKMISTYTQYLPTTGDIKAKKLTQGAAYKIGCWINETTTVKARAGVASSSTAPKKTTTTTPKKK